MRILHLLSACLLASTLPGQLTTVPGGFVSRNQLPQQAAALDWDRDGLTDVVIDSRTDVLLQRSNGDGTFQEVTLLTQTPYDGVGYLIPVDFDRDGDPDVILSSRVRGTNNSEFGLIRNDGGAATLVRMGQHSLSSRPVATGDFNGDGYPDIAAFQGSTVEIALNDRAGNLTTAVEVLTWPGVQDMVVGDWDEDGVDDLAFPHEFGSFVFFLWGDPASLFPDFSTHPVQSLPTLIAKADLDSDGDMDLVLCSDRTADVETVLNDGARRFTTRSRRFTRSGSVYLEVGDFTRDGNPDVVTVSRTFISLLETDGTGQITSLVWSPININDNAGTATGDFNADGVLDLLYPAGNFMGLVSTAPAVSGSQVFGTGTPGCFGSGTLSATSDPTVGNSSFALAAAGAPSSAFGLLAISDTPDVAGSDPFNRGVLAHVVPSATTALYLFFSRNDGTCFLPLGIPNDPGLRGLSVHAQGVWLEERPGFICTPNPFGIVTSRGLSITIQ